MNNIKRELLSTHTLPETDPFFFDRATSDVTGMRSRFQYEREEKLRRLGVTYDEDISELTGPNE